MKPCCLAFGLWYLCLLSKTKNGTIGKMVKIKPRLSSSSVA